MKERQILCELANDLATLAVLNLHNLTYCVFEGMLDCEIRVMPPDLAQIAVVTDMVPYSILLQVIVLLFFSRNFRAQFKGF